MPAVHSLWWLNGFSEVTVIYRVALRILGLIPAFVRRPVSNAAMSVILKNRINMRTLRTGPVTVAGFLRSSIGIGEAARLTLFAFRELGFDTRYADLSQFFPWRENVAADLGKESVPDEGGQLIVHLNPPELLYGLSVLGHKAVRHKRIIGYWVWELQNIPKNWIDAFQYVDEVWVPTRFVANAVSAHTSVPVRVVPYPVRRGISSARGRKDFGLSEDAVIFLAMCDARSGLVRKNPLGAINAFQLAFGSDPRFLLVAKISEEGAAPGLMAELERATKGASNIKFLHQKLQREDTVALMGCADIIISLHRSEGFGLVLAEAMLQGKPVVATGWSGNVDFMNAGNSALIDYQLVPVRDKQGIYLDSDQFWAEPVLDQATDWLRNLALNNEMRKQLGLAAMRDAEKFFGLESFKEAVGNIT